MEGRLTGFSLNRDGSQNVTVTVAADFSEMYDELKDRPLYIVAETLNAEEAKSYR